MFKPGVYGIMPPLKRAQFIIALIWALAILLVSIGLYSAQAGGGVQAPTPAAVQERLGTRILPAP